MTVSRAVIPAAGLGTRFLPVTLAVPKELLPLNRRPAIHAVVKEAADCGIETVVLVLYRGKESVLHYFLENTAFADKIRDPDCLRLVNEVRELRRRIKFVAVYQDEVRGLGHAVLTAQPAVGNNPFALMLPDDHFKPSPLPSLLDAYSRHGLGGIALRKVEPESTRRWGIVATCGKLEEGFRVCGAVEKPAPADAPSDLAIMGRYVLPPEVFEILSETKPGKLGEIQLTDALDKLARNVGMYGFLFSGTYVDLGTWEGYLLANAAEACADPQFASRLRETVINH